MTPGLALLPAAALAAVDWWAVAARRRRLEAVVKPAVMVALAAGLFALPARVEAERWWFVAALACSLAGDVLLLPRLDRFRLGLAAFLAGHLAYLAGFRTVPFHPAALWIAVPLLAAAAAAVGPPILRRADSALRAPIAAYLVVILAMAASAAASPSRPALAGAALFLASDGMLAWDRFVKPLPAGRLLVISTYHAGQILLALSVWIW